MGHAIHYDTFRTKTSKKDIYSLVNKRAVEEGDSHSGLYKDIRWYNQCLNSEEEAIEFIERHDKGWYDQLAVKFKHQKNFKPSKALNQLKARLEKATRTYKETSSNPHFTNHKSNLIGCKSCGSKLATKHIRYKNFCPVCSADLRPPSVLKAIQDLKEKKEALEAEVAKKEYDERMKSIDKAEEFWLVKTEFHV